MIIWTGWGFLVFVITFLASLLSEFITESIFNDENYYQTHSLPLAIALIISAIINGFLGKKLNNQDTRILIDKVTGEEVILKKNHSLFFIKMEYWSVILFIGSIFALIFYNPL